MRRSGAGAMVVESVAELLPALRSPPPDTVAVLATDAGAVAETVTVRVIAGYEELPARTSERVHGPAGWVQVQPVPDMAVATRPEGSVSETVTAPAVGAAAPLLTAIEYVLPACPCVKLPEC